MTTTAADTLAQPAFTTRTSCRACGKADFHVVLDLGEQPLANGFRCPCDTGPEARYPLTLVRCGECELVQLTVVVDPTVMFGSHYPYRSGMAPGWAAHCHALAKEIGSGKKVLEIGCLDGVMLRHCRDNGCTVWGVDPSSPHEDLPIIREFWHRDINATGTPDVIIAQNVFGHVDDVKGFLEGCEKNLAPEGEIIIECPWVLDLVHRVRWDTIYHEHLSYWGVRPLVLLAATVGLRVFKVLYLPEIHGGTMRYYLGRARTTDHSVQVLWRDEERAERDWKTFRERVSQQVDHWERWFHDNESWATVAAYGASAKLNTFLNTLSSRPPLLGVFDDTPSKIGKITPGWHFPVLAPTREVMENVDVLLVGSPNWKAELERMARSHGFIGEVLSLWD